MTSITARGPQCPDLPRPQPRMRRVSRRVASDLVGACDALAIVLGTGVAGMLGGWLAGAPADAWRLAVAGLLGGLVHAALLSAAEGREPGRLHAIPVTGWRRALAALIAHAAVLVLVLPAGSAVAGGFAALAAGTLASISVSIAVRLAARRLLRRLAVAGAFDARIAVYGNGAVAARVAAHLADPSPGVAFAGRYDDRGARRQECDADAPAGSLDDLVALGRAGAIDQVVIALPQAAVGRTEAILRRLEHLPLRISIVTHIASDLVDGGPAHRVASLGAVGLLTVKAKPLDGWGTVLKAAEDYVLGTVLLVVALPVMALVALAVRLESPGPVLFRQRRRGLNSRVFEVLKFRTMRVAEDGAVVRQAMRDDPRITRVGRFLRRSSLDELPQLLNVIRGEMSLVGPRPHAVAHDDYYAEIIRRYPSRQQVKPGITGLAQVKGLRGETETPEKMQARVEQDLVYVAGWSLGLDLRILALTVVKAWSGKNAY